MSADTLLSLLRKIRKTGPGTWNACCPAHEDKSPSMSIKETADGRVLVHCFGGCSVESILAAVDLTFDDLFPEKETSSTGERRPFPAADVLRLISKEAMVVAASSATLRKRALSDLEHDRLIRATETILKALSASGIRYENNYP